MADAPAFGFEDGGLLRGFGAGDCCLPVRFRRLDDRGFEFLLSAQDFLLLDRDHFLRPRFFDAHFFGDDALSRGRFRQRTGLLGACLLRFDLSLVLRLANHEIPGRQRDLRVGLELRLLAFLQGLRRFDLRVAVSFSFADGCVALDLRGPALAERVEVALLVADLLDRQNVNADAHLLEIGRGLGRQFLREALAIAVDLFHRERAEDRPQVAFERLEDDLLDDVMCHAQEALGGRLERAVVAADLHVGDGLDRDGNALQRVGPLDLERDRHHVEMQVLDLLQERDPQGGAAAHHPVADDTAVRKLALASAEDRDGVWRDLDVIPAEDVHRREEREHDRGNGKNDVEGRVVIRHGAFPYCFLTMTVSPRTSSMRIDAFSAIAPPSRVRAILSMSSSPNRTLT